MSHVSVNPRCPVCNQSFLSPETAFRVSELVDQLAWASTLLTRIVTMIYIACGVALNEVLPSHRYYYLETLAEMAETALMQVDEALAAVRPGDSDE